MPLDKLNQSLIRETVALLREEMEYLGAVKISAVEEQQQKIVDVIRGLEDAGELVLNPANEEEVLVQ